MMKKVALPTFATAHLLAGCTAAMDEKNCVPPDIPTAHIAIQGYKAYAESLWYNHYHTDAGESLVLVKLTPKNTHSAIRNDGTVVMSI